MTAHEVTLRRTPSGKVNVYRGDLRIAMLVPVPRPEHAPWWNAYLLAGGELKRDLGTHQTRAAAIAAVVQAAGQSRRRAPLHSHAHGRR